MAAESVVEPATEWFVVMGFAVAPAEQMLPAGVAEKAQPGSFYGSAPLFWDVFPVLLLQLALPVFFFRCPRPDYESSSSRCSGPSEYRTKALPRCDNGLWGPTPGPFEGSGPERD